MRIQLLSDLHTEHYIEPLRFLNNRIQLVPCDVRVLAGDIVSVFQQSPEQLRAILYHLSLDARHTIYISGNHEYYCAKSAAAVEGYLRSIAGCIPNFHFLENSDVWIDGQQFFGGTMWFDWQESNHWYSIGEDAWSDFKDIEDKDFRTWVYEYNKAFTKAALETVKPGAVVVSHHLPNLRSVSKRFQSYNSNRWFVSDQTQCMFDNGVRLWLHGHTHDACDYVFGDTRVVCNPYGYYWVEKSRGYPAVLLDV